MAEVEIDKVLGFMGKVGTEATAHDAVPGGVLLLFEVLLDEGSDVLFDLNFFEGLVADVDGVLLHVL